MSGGFRVPDDEDPDDHESIATMTKAEVEHMVRQEMDQRLRENDENWQHYLEQMMHERDMNYGEEWRKREQALQEDMVRAKHSNGSGRGSKKPCPKFGDNDPEKDAKLGPREFRVWKIQILLWWNDSEVNMASTSSKVTEVVGSLQGKAAEIVTTQIPIHVLMQDDGMQYIVHFLELFYEGDKSANITKACNEFLDCVRGDKTMVLYISDMRQKLGTLESFGVALPDPFYSSVLLRNSGLDESDRAMVLASTGRDLGRTQMEAALTQLFPSTPAQTNSTTFATYSDWNQKGGRKGEKGKGKGMGKGKGKGEPWTSSYSKDVKCYRCQKHGHYARDCQAPTPVKTFFGDYNEGDYNEGDKQKPESSDVSKVVFTFFGNSMMSLSEECKLHGILDIGCIHTVAGSRWLQRLRHSNVVNIIDVKPTMRWFQFGTGNPTQSIKTVQIQISSIAIDTYLNVDIIDGDLPLLISKESMKGLRMNIDMTCNNVEVHVPHLKEVLLIKCKEAATGHMMFPLSCDWNMQHLTFVSLGKINTMEQLKQKYMKLHKQFNHCNKAKLSQMIKQAFPELDMDMLKQIENEFKCDVCDRHGPQKHKPIVSFEPEPYFNKHLALDLMFVNDIPILHVIDTFTRFGMATMVKSKEGNHILKAFCEMWIKVFSKPKSLLSDLGKEFDNKMFRFLSDKLDVALKVVGAGAHWPLVVERHHATLRKLIVLALQDNPRLPMDEAISSATHAKNCIPMSNGYSPYFLVFKQAPRLPNFMEEHEGQMGTLEPIHGQELHEQYISNMVRQHILATKHFYEIDLRERILRADRHPHYKSEKHRFKLGDEVLYWRDPTHKGMAGWHGPGIIIGGDEELLVVKHGGSVFRLNSTHVMPFTKDEGVLEFEGEEGRVLTKTSTKQGSTSKGIEKATEACDGEERETFDKDANSKSGENTIEEGLGTSTFNAPSSHRDLLNAFTPIGESDLPRMRLHENKALAKRNEKNDEEINPNDCPKDAPFILDHETHERVDLDHARTDSTQGRKNDDKDEIVQERRITRSQTRLARMKQDEKVNVANIKHDNVNVQHMKVNDPYPIPVNDDDNIMFADDIEVILLAAVEKNNTVPVELKEQLRMSCDLDSTDFEEAKLEELQQWREFGVYTPVARATATNVVSLRWVLTNKPLDTGGTKKKARLVVRGYEDVDKDAIERRSPTISKESLKLLVSFLAANQFTPNKIDVKGAFLQSDSLDRVICVKPPKEAGCDSETVWQLNKGVYGTGDAARCWFNTLSSRAKECGFKECAMDACLYVYQNSVGEVMGAIGWHVDDIIYGGNCEFKSLVNELFSKFKIGTKQHTNFPFLGVNLSTQFDDNGVMQSIALSQVQYIESIAPPVFDNKKMGIDFASESEHSEFRRVVGELLWVTHYTRPDLSFRVVELSMALQAPTISHLRLLTRLLSNAKRKRLDIVYKCTLGKPSMHSYSDASFGSGPNSSSIGGLIVCLVFPDGTMHPICWRSYKIKRVVRSTLAGETLAVADLLDKVHVLKKTSEFIWSQSLSSSIYTDCQSLIDCVFDHRQITEKRLLIEIQVIKELMKCGEINSFEWVPTDKQLADVFTKRMNPNLLFRCIESCSLTPIDYPCK